MAMPQLGLSLGISPISSASADTGMKMFGDAGGPATGAINVGGGAGAGNSWLSGVVRDFAIGVAVALAAKYAWGKLK